MLSYMKCGETECEKPRLLESGYCAEHQRISQRGTTGAEGLSELEQKFRDWAVAEGEEYAEQAYKACADAVRDAATQRAPVTPPQGGPFSESLKKPSRDCVWIVEQNGRVHSVHSTHASAMKEQGENLRIGAPWQVLPWATPAPVTTPGRDEGPREVKLRRALRKYGVHQERCEAFLDECTCGLEAAAKEPRG